MEIKSYNTIIKLVDLAIFLPKSKTLIISDTHIGYEEHLRKKGLLIPGVFFKEQYERMKKIASSVEFDRIIINGDFKEEFGDINDSEWRNSIKFLDIFNGKEIIIIEGNHDKIIRPLLKKRNIKLNQYFVEDDILICHGDVIIDKVHDREIKTMIIGHEHPAIDLTDDVRTEQYKCFLWGKYKDINMLVQPSFKLGVQGTNVLEKNFLSPFLSSNSKLGEFHLFVIEDKVYDFGKIKNVKNNIAKTDYK